MAMKINMPITDTEQFMKEGDILVSKTDLKGSITFVNRAFIELSGFTEEELLRKSHSIVRHPDMPPAAFKDLWETIQKGCPWTGIIKNRVKNGDFYWVVANVIPIKKNGQVIEFMSVRTKPTLQEIKEAELTYQAMNTDSVPRKNPLVTLKTLLVNTGLKAKLTILTTFIAFILVAGALIQYDNVHKIDTAWDSYQANISARGTVINEITASLGYGGIVHQFKNYILRQDDAYRQTFIQRYTSLLSQVNHYQALSGITAKEQNALKDIVNVANQYRQNLDSVQSLITNGAGIKAIDSSVKVDSKPALNALVLLQQNYASLTQQATNTLHTQINDSFISLGAERLVTFLILALLSVMVLSRAIMKPIKQLIGIFNNINEGKYENKFEIRNNSEFGKLFQAIYVTQTKLNFDIQESRLTAEEALRIKNALDNVTANVMVADGQRNIIYMNESVNKLLSNAEKDFKKDLPDFSVENLLGANIDVFHKRPQHQQQMLQGLSSTHQANIKLGGRTMQLTLNPVTNAANERLGTVVEWNDKTAELAIEQEIDEIVAAAANGDLSKRISLEGKNEFFTKLSSGLNELLESSSLFVSDVGSLFSRMSEGDLTQSIEQEYNGEFQQIKNDANNTIDKLTSIISQIRESANTVSTASHEIALGNTDLSQRTEEQACSLEETASSMEEITATVKQSAANTDEANKLATEAKNKAQNGGKTVQDAVSAMKEILTASNRINDIIGVIDEIAFQTNLLALNAAVEAARAGEQGRGFAVVAGEVRNLSQRSADAAKEIKDLIRDSVEKVKVGSSLVNDSGETLQEIVHSVEHVANMISEVSNAATEQSSGIEQVNLAVNQMDEVTQQNAALVEQASVASSAMSEQVNHMTQLIQFFKLIQSEQEERQIQNGQHPAPGQLQHNQGAPRQQGSQRRSTNANHNQRSGQQTAQPVTAQQLQSNNKAIAALSNNDSWDEF
ncbi:methyl-accepting chemotaxis protein [Moritella dasanensis]|uniref:methyl-accepting chemotaxis protein n=1 Tax=Moritella dasanensis TaxID=428031 RepID=UPI0002FBAFEC|nr:methyl-accepting chemotaxis protein [Moritella dasanensis]